MNKNFSDEKLDQILRQIVKDTVLSNKEIDEIAESPNLWRNVQRNINEAQTNRQKSWFPVWFGWRIAAFASAFLVVCFGLFLAFNQQNGGENLAEVKAIEIQSIETPKVDEIPQDADKQQFTPTKISEKTSPKKAVSPKKETQLNVSRSSSKRAPHLSNTPKVETKTEEVRTDFIALSYSPAAESGQILKVKVPRSMMVSLGVSNGVENGSELVNAEVLVGDDGLARAIRFIQ